MATLRKHILKIDGLKLEVGDGASRRCLLEDSELSIESGQLVALMGVSGSGKTSLLRCIAGILKPSGGEITLDNSSIWNLNPKARAKLRREEIAFIFQDSNLLKMLTVRENIEIPWLIKGKHPDTERVVAAAERLGIAEHLNVFPDSLSGGERQRVAVARALANEAMLVLADEPTGSLDEENALRTMKEMRKLAVAGAACLVATHDAQVAVKADFVVRIHHQRLVKADA